MIGNYIYGAQAVLLCYDITNYQSFQNLEDWYRLVQNTFRGQHMPRVTLIGNKTDLNHLRTVKVEKHNQFADENEMFSCFMSAKTGVRPWPSAFAKASILCSSPRLPGDNVSQCFYRVAADLAGVVLTKPELEVASKVVKAEIINHPQDEEGGATTSSAKKKSGGCIVQ